MAEPARKLTRDVLVSRITQIEDVAKSVQKLCYDLKQDILHAPQVKRQAPVQRPPAQLADGEVPGRAEGSRALRSAPPPPPPDDEPDGEPRTAPRGRGQRPQQRQEQPRGGGAGAEFSGRPWKFDDGTYGVLLDDGQDGEDGSTVRVSARSGKEWTNTLREYVGRFRDANEIWKVDGRRDS